MNYDWDFSVFTPYYSAFAKGAWVTVELSVLSSLLGTVLGFVAAFMLRLPFLGKVFVAANDVMRAIPLLVLLFFSITFRMPRSLVCDRRVLSPPRLWH